MHRRIVLSLGFAAVAILVIRSLLGAGLILVPRPLPLSEPVRTAESPLPPVASDWEEAARERTTATFRERQPQNRFPTLEIGPIPSLPRSYPVAPHDRSSDKSPARRIPVANGQDPIAASETRPNRSSDSPAIAEPPLVPIPRLSR